MGIIIGILVEGEGTIFCSCQFEGGGTLGNDPPECVVYRGDMVMFKTWHYSVWGLSIAAALVTTYWWCTTEPPCAGSHLLIAQVIFHSLAAVMLGLMVDDFEAFWLKLAGGGITLVSTTCQGSRFRRGSHVSICRSYLHCPPHCALCSPSLWLLQFYLPLAFHVLAVCCAGLTFGVCGGDTEFPTAATTDVEQAVVATAS